MSRERGIGRGFYDGAAWPPYVVARRAQKATHRQRIKGEVTRLFSQGGLDMPFGSQSSHRGAQGDTGHVRIPPRHPKTSEIFPSLFTYPCLGRFLQSTSCGKCTVSQVRRGRGRGPVRRSVYQGGEGRAGARVSLPFIFRGPVCLGCVTSGRGETWRLGWGCYMEWCLVYFLFHGKRLFAAFWRLGGERGFPSVCDGRG